MSARGTLACLLAASLGACSPASRRTADAAADSVPPSPATASPTVAAAPALVGAPSSTPATPSLSAADSVRGIVARVGSDPGSVLTVRASDGYTCALQMTPPVAVEGLEVAFWGAKSSASVAMPGVSCTLIVDRFAVRAVDGTAAVDGTLLQTGTTYAIVLASGRRLTLSHVPKALLALSGARIYWAGAVDQAPAAYGVLEPNP